MQFEPITFNVGDGTVTVARWPLRVLMRRDFDEHVRQLPPPAPQIKRVGQDELHISVNNGWGRYRITGGDAEALHLTVLESVVSSEPAAADPLPLAVAKI
jgi:hypothetical protein